MVVTDSAVNGAGGEGLSARRSGVLPPVLRPALARLAGYHYEPSMTSAVLTPDLPENDRRQDYLRSVLGHDEHGNAVVTPTARQDSSMIGVFAAANALVVRPPFDRSRAAGDLVQVILLDPRL